MLIASLPRLERLFLAKQPPLSRIALERRLRILAPEDQKDLRLVEQALNWREFSMEASDADVIGRARTALALLDQPTIRKLICERLELRTAIAALRRRASGQGPPPAGVVWGFGRWVDRIARNWTDPVFQLGGVFSWLREADQLLQQGDARALERLVLEQSYRKLQRHDADHHFDFEAVVIYVLKWSIVDRWARSNTEAAARRFEDLTNQALAGHGEISFGEET